MKIKNSNSCSQKYKNLKKNKIITKIPEKDSSTKRLETAFGKKRFSQIVGEIF